MNFIKSFSRLRETLKGSKYLLSNPQVGAFAVTAKDIVSWSSIVNGTKITILISSAFSLIDYFTTKDGKADFTDIAVNLLTGIGKALVAYWVGTAAATLAVIAGGVLVSAGVIMSVSALVVFSIGAIVSIFVGVGLNMADDKYSWTTTLQEKVNEIQASFKFKIETVEEGPKESLEEFLDYLYRGLDYFIYTGGYSVPYSKPY